MTTAASKALGLPPVAKTNRMMPAFNKVPSNATLDRALKEARIGFMSVCPFLSHLYFAELQEIWTLDVPTAATDGRRIALNPEYLAKLKPAQRIFVLAHEVDHALCRHPQRMKHYQDTAGPDGQPFDWDLFNQAADYVINARLVENQIGAIHPDWLYRKDITGSMLAEDVYNMLKKEQKGQQGGKGQAGKDGQPGQGAPSGSGPAGGDVMAPRTDPVTGREDSMSDTAFKEAVARAAAVAKGRGKLPGAYQKMVEEIMDHQIPWAEHIRLTMAGRLGSNQETWTKLNRRRLALNPAVCLPGRRGYGCDTIVVGLDTSGSIYADQKLLSVFFAEMGGIIADVHPRRLVIVHCDARVQHVDEVRTMDEVDSARRRGAKGGGGTSFIPVFEWCRENNVRPDMLVYLTDGYGTFPSDPPAYPVLWAMNTDVQAPFGDVVRVKI